MPPGVIEDALMELGWPLAKEGGERLFWFNAMDTKHQPLDVHQFNPTLALRHCSAE